MRFSKEIKYPDYLKWDTNFKNSLWKSITKTRIKILKVEKIQTWIPLTTSGKPTWTPDTHLGFCSYWLRFLTSTLLHCLFLVMSVDFLGKNRSFHFIMIMLSTLQKRCYKRAPKMDIVPSAFITWFAQFFQVFMKLAK